MTFMVRIPLKISKRNQEKQRAQEDEEINALVKKIKTFAQYDLQVSTRPDLILACRAFMKSFYG